MPDIKLKTVDKVDFKTRSILQNAVPKGKPLLTGGGNHNYLCGKCGTVIGKDVAASTNFVSADGQPVLVTCNSCDSYNELPQSQGQ